MSWAPNPFVGSASHQLPLCQPHWPLCKSTLKYYTAEVSHVRPQKWPPLSLHSLPPIPTSPQYLLQRHLLRGLLLSSDRVFYLFTVHTLSGAASKQSIIRILPSSHRSPSNQSLAGTRSVQEILSKERGGLEIYSKMLCYCVYSAPDLFWKWLCLVPLVESLVPTLQKLAIGWAI